MPTFPAIHVSNGSIRAGLTARLSLPFFPGEQTFSHPIGMSEKRPINDIARVCFAEI